MALGKQCPCGKEKAGKFSIYGKNCRRLRRVWGEERDLADVRRRDEDLDRWHGPVKARLEDHQKKSKVVKISIVRRSAA